MPGAKRKRVGSSGVGQARDGDGEAASHSHDQAAVDREHRHKRWTLACKRHTGSFPPPAGPDRSVVMAMARVCRRIGTPNLW